MRIALLSAGESLDRFDESAAYDLRIAVNTAAERFRCDWWSVGDHQPYLDIAAIDKDQIRVFMMRGEIGHLESLGVRLGERALAWDAINGLCPVVNWHEFSATAALVLAVQLGATAIDCYGCDMRGTKDYAGRSDIGGRPAVRSEEDRWPRERRIWNDLIEWLESLGIAVKRIGHPAAQVLEAPHVVA